jgi:hypothetical protein
LIQEPGLVLATEVMPGMVPEMERVVAFAVKQNAHANDTTMIPPIIFFIIA